MIAWSLLNIILLLVFIYSWAKAARLLWQSAHSWLAVAFVVGSVGIAGAHYATPTNTIPALAQPGSSARQVIHHALGQEISLRVTYSHDSTGRRMLNGTTYLSGFVSGFSWQPGIVQLTGPAYAPHYTATGNMRWLLLGIPVYTQAAQVFEGPLAAAGQPVAHL
jgi:hypothetical protein